MSLLAKSKGEVTYKELSTLHKWALVVLISMGSSIIYAPMYLKNVFYDPLMQALGATNADLGLMVSAYGIAAIYPAAGKSDAVLEGLNAFIDRQKQSFEQYLADQYEIAGNARLETLEDGTILLVMCEDQDAVFDAFRDTIEGAA